MASIYVRADSAFVWMRFKDPDGQWRGRATEYRKDNLGDMRQAKLAARILSAEERKRAPVRAGDAFANWVENWIDARYGANRATTATVYRRYWRTLSRWMTEVGISAPAQFGYKHVAIYRAWRMRDAASNSALNELKFLGVVMGEALKRGFISSNPCLRMGIRKTDAKEKAAWTDAEISKVGKAAEKQPQWIQATFVLGLYQASRLRQCCVPIGDIDLTRLRITYAKTKGNKPFSQPLDARAVETLRKIISARKRDGQRMLFDWPATPPSVLWRQFLDTLGLRHLSHHGLRVTWITRAALSGRVSLTFAKAFVNHGSTTVHALYQKLNADDLAGVPSALNLPRI